MNSLHNQTIPAALRVLIPQVNSKRVFKLNFVLHDHFYTTTDEFDDDQEPSVIAKTIQKLAVEIVGRISTTNSQSNLIHELRSLLRLGRSNYVWYTHKKQKLLQLSKISAFYLTYPFIMQLDEEQRLCRSSSPLCGFHGIYVESDQIRHRLMEGNGRSDSVDIPCRHRIRL